MNEAVEPPPVAGDTSVPAEPVSAEDGQLAVVLARLRELRQQLPAEARAKLYPLLDSNRISHDTGLTPERVTELLDGASPEQQATKEAVQTRFLRRLTFLRETRLKQPVTRRLSGRTPRPYTYGEIARGAQISRQTVHYIFTEGRQASPETIARIERFFGALPGFCSYTESEALVASLRPIVRELTFLNKVTDALAHGVTRVAARSTEELGQDTDAMDGILAAVIAARRQEEPG
ncbi:hypothetical protein ADK57_17665 [Streptomyces sp. MMG1533]|uniref:hypothetical protein n=1 Tax=Streptomyces sp. MMG1533 TaxID=1415546 RepID=UPI0006AD9BBD|nr:hypothetical protein [Streptomyces sp. MMG1533]KOU66813.1 hypothetical protein ADK57_17665 [Streptomyces sp. MMG1533]